jgi:ATP-dependent protease ClpP protease subunit
VENIEERKQILGSEDYERVWLLERGIIDHVGGIYDEDARQIGTCLDRIEELNRIGNLKLDTVRIRIWSSPGGGVGGALAAYDYIRAFAARTGMNIQTEAYGYAASAAAMVLLQAGDERLASESCTFLLHEVRQFTGWETETYSNIKDKQIGMDMVTKLVYNILALKSGKHYDEVNDTIDRREAWMSFAEAMEWGLIDGSI